MMTSRLKASLIILPTGFILGFFTSFLIFAHTKSSSYKPVVVQNVKELKKSADTIDIAYQQQIEALQDQNIELQQQFEVSQGLLLQAKQEAQRKEDNVKQLIVQQSLFRNKPSRPTSSPHPLKTYLTPRQRELLDYDNLALFQNDQLRDSCICDSLEKEVQEYIEANHRKDSAYELQLISFDSVLSNKDNIIEASQKAYDNLKALLDKSTANQTALQKENKQLRNRNARQRFQSKVVTAACIVLSGIAVSFFLHR